MPASRCASLRTDQPNPEGAFCFYAPSSTLGRRSAWTSKPSSDMPSRRHELQLYYQPKYDVATETVIGAECLMRWLHPQRGFISPVEFIPLAEETGLILEMGRHVLEEACRQLAEWSSEGLDAGMLAVNVSGAAVSPPGLRQFQVRDALSRFGVAASGSDRGHRSPLLADRTGQATRMLNELAGALGLHMSIDDSGTAIRRYPCIAYATDRQLRSTAASSSMWRPAATAPRSFAHPRAGPWPRHGGGGRRRRNARSARLPARARLRRLPGFLFSKAVPAPEFKRCSLRQPVVDSPRAAPAQGVGRATTPSNNCCIERAWRRSPANAGTTRADRADSRLALPRFRQPRRCQPCAKARR